MKRLSALDALYVAVDSQSTPMIISDLHVFELPEGLSGQAWAAQVRERLASLVSRVPFMQQRLHLDPLSIDRPIWVSAPVDIDWHVSEFPCEDGDDAALERLVGDLSSHMFDRRRAMWKVFLVRELSARRVALFFCRHHAYGDAHLHLLFNELLMDGGRQAEDLPEVQRLRIPSLAQRLAGAGEALWKAADGVVSGTFEAASAASELSRQVCSEDNPLTPLWPPKVGFNAALSPGRRVVFGQVPLSGVRRTAKSFGVTVNDVLMAAVGGAFRAYQAGAEEGLPERSLSAMCAVSRSAGDRLMDGGNHTAALVVSLGTDIEARADRVISVARSSANAKAALQSLDPCLDNELQLFADTQLATFGARWLERLELADHAPMPHNLVVSNVRGPDEAPKLAGAVAVAGYFLSVLYHGLGVSVTSYSTGGQLNLSLLADARLVPDVARLRNLLVEELRALIELG